MLSYKNKNSTTGITMVENPFRGIKVPYLRKQGKQLIIVAMVAET